MLNLAENMIVIDGDIKTYQVEKIEYASGRYDVRFSNSYKTYQYSTQKISWLTKHATTDVRKCRVYIDGKREPNAVTVHTFKQFMATYHAVIFSNGFIRQIYNRQLEVRRSCLSGASEKVFSYIGKCAGLSSIGKTEGEDDKPGLLATLYSRLGFIDDSTAASLYLDSSKKIGRGDVSTVIFPYGCNSSQSKAVSAALGNQLSIIQGPPGTGKTQTILNIIANLLVRGKSVLVVSNNNSATDNIYDKLVSDGLGFLVARLGRKEIREAFIANQPRLSPILPEWRKGEREIEEALSQASEAQAQLGRLFAVQERLACCRQELKDVRIEKEHFLKSHPDTFHKGRFNASSARILNILNRLKSYMNRSEGGANGLISRIRLTLDEIYIGFSLRFGLRINTKVLPATVPALLSTVESTFYNRRISELETEIDRLEKELAGHDVKSLLSRLTACSCHYLRAVLARRFSTPRKVVESVREMFDHGNEFVKDFPVVLSTTFSAKMCFNDETLFDYVIMDESSQISIDTGLLALACARNAVIVGDDKQLPNVVENNVSEHLRALCHDENIPDCYDCGHKSLLDSMLEVRRNAVSTLLREHYRCHPDIINFCNQKFYGGDLVIMTSGSEEDVPMKAVVTSGGHHSRGHFNQREIDTVRLEILPTIKESSDICIITPYRKQAEEFASQIPGIEAATVHKFQGREKDTIIMSVTDDVITEFADDPNLLNVAVSRARKSFYLVISGNEQQIKGNLHDLVDYINYRYGAVAHSRLHSIFDYLHTHTTEPSDGSTDSFASEYESERLTHGLIVKILSGHPKLSHLKVLSHYPLRNLIRDTDLLDEDERRYVSHPSTHVDFLIINRVSKVPLIAIETDGYSYHNESTRQHSRDVMKDRILELYGLPLLRLSTVGHSEEQRILDTLAECVEM